MKRLLTGLAVTAALASCTSNTADEARIQEAKQFTIDSMKAVTADKEAEAKLEAARTRSSTPRRSSGGNTVVYRSYSEPGTTSSSRDAHDRPGWSNKAKGAVVGGVVGAVTGAAVSDKKAKGAVIGGVVGAAGGYGVGAILDKKKKDQ